MNFGQEIRKIVNQINNLPLNDRNSIYELLEHDEWGVALESLCAALYEENIKISKSIYETIRKIGQEMEMAPSTWELLKNLISLY